MKKGNVIDLMMYRNQRDAHHPNPNLEISEELTKAIQSLIHRLRELGPIKQSN